MKKFTFKTTKPTGSYSSFYPNSHAIKFDKKKCGAISDSEWRIRLMVEKEDIMEDGNPNCAYKWITLAKESKTLQEAKDFLNENREMIFEKYKIHFSESN